MINYDSLEARLRVGFAGWGCTPSGVAKKAIEIVEEWLKDGLDSYCDTEAPKVSYEQQKALKRKFAYELLDKLKLEKD